MSRIIKLVADEGAAQSEPGGVQEHVRRPVRILGNEIAPGREKLRSLEQTPSAVEAYCRARASRPQPGRPGAERRQLDHAQAQDVRSSVAGLPGPELEGTLSRLTTPMASPPCSSRPTFIWAMLTPSSPSVRPMKPIRPGRSRWVKISSVPSMWASSR